MDLCLNTQLIRPLFIEVQASSSTIWGKNIPGLAFEKLATYGQACKVEQLVFCQHAPFKTASGRSSRRATCLRCLQSLQSSGSSSSSVASPSQSTTGMFTAVSCSCNVERTSMHRVQEIKSVRRNSTSD